MTPSDDERLSDEVACGLLQEKLNRMRQENYLNMPPGPTMALHGYVWEKQPVEPGYIMAPTDKKYLFELITFSAKS